MIGTTSMWRSGRNGDHSSDLRLVGKRNIPSHVLLYTDYWSIVQIVRQLKLYLDKQRSVVFDEMGNVGSKDENRCRASQPLVG